MAENIRKNSIVVDNLDKNKNNYIQKLILYNKKQSKK